MTTRDNNKRTRNKSGHRTLSAQFNNKVREVAIVRMTYGRSMHVPTLIFNFIFAFVILSSALAFGRCPKKLTVTRLFVSSDGGDKVAANIAAVGAVQSSNVFKLVNTLDEISSAYEDILKQMEELNKRANELQLRKTKSDRLYVRFKSMSPRTLHIWKANNDKSDCLGVPLSSFISEASLITTGIEGDRYLFSACSEIEPDFSNIIGEVVISRDREVYYLYDDPKYPPTVRQLQLLEAECKHSNAVKLSTGIT